MMTNNIGNGEEESASSDDAAATAMPPATRALPLPHILCVGIAALDAIATADHFPSPDEKMRSETLSYHGGGNAANTACGIGRQSELIQCSLLGGVGDDRNGAIILQSLRDDHHVNIDLCQTWSNSPSPFSYILVVGDTRTCIHQPASAVLTIEHVQTVLPPSSSIENSDDALHQFRAVHFDGRHPAAAGYLAERCHRLGIPYSIDVERPREGLDFLLKYASIVIVNESYFCQNVMVQPDHDDDEKNLSVHVKLRTVMTQQAPRAVYVIQTMGAQGCCLVRLQASSRRRTTKTSEDRPPPRKGAKRTIILPGTDHVPAVERHDYASDDDSYALYCGSFRVDAVVDTTGAGDAFQSGLLAALWSLPKVDDGNEDDDWRHLDDVSLGRLLRIGSRFASESIRQLGARDGLPSFATDDFLRTELAELRQRRRRPTSHPIPPPMAE
jgi:sugar/nucleoside kinase (ribokinase family)